MHVIVLKGLFLEDVLKANNKTSLAISLIVRLKPQFPCTQNKDRAMSYDCRASEIDNTE